jgi:heat shock protein HslJ
MLHSRQTMIALTMLAIALAACISPSETVKQPGTPANLDGTKWVLVSLKGSSPIEGSVVTLAFYPDNYLEGDAGCNSYGADYSTSDNDFHLSEIHRTALDCDVAESILQQEAAYFEALQDVTVYGLKDGRLEFHNATGETILTFAEEQPPSVDPALKDTEWTLTSLHGTSLLEGSHITLNLGPEGVGGFAGCNRYGGEYAAADEGALATSKLWLTAMECEPPALHDQEQAYIEALNNAAAYRVLDDRLEVDNAAGETTLVFARKEEFSMNPGDLVGTEWQLFSMNDGGDFVGDLVEGATFTLAFHDEYRVSGHAGCRGYVATYEASGDDVGFPLYAMMGSFELCSEALMEQEGLYTTILGWATDYRLGEGRLEILTARDEVLVFEPLPEDADASLEGTAWTLTAFIEEKQVEEMPTPLLMPMDVLAETEITASFENGTLRGSAGCNTTSGAYAFDGSFFNVETLAATEMACGGPVGVMEQEQRYLGFLRDVTVYRIHGSQLWLETGDGRALVFTVKVTGYNLADLIEDLRAAGLTVEPSGQLVDHGFTIKGRRVVVNDAPIFVYEFADIAAAETASAGVSADRYSMTITRAEGGATVVVHSDWVETPHLYKKGQLIVISGDHPDVLNALDAVLGPRLTRPPLP